MILLGLLLMAAAVAAAIILVVQNDGTIRVHVFNSDYNMPAYWLAIAGLAIMAVFAVGWWLTRAGAAHSLRRRRERRDLVKENRRLSEREAALRAQTAPTVASTEAGSGQSRTVDQNAGPARTVEQTRTTERIDEPRRVPPAQ
jgi:hypothetical protein